MYCINKKKKYFRRTEIINESTYFIPFISHKIIFIQIRIKVNIRTKDLLSLSVHIWLLKRFHVQSARDMCYEYQKTMEEIKRERDVKRETTRKQKMLDRKREEKMRKLKETVAKAAHILCAHILEYNCREGMYFIGTATFNRLTGYSIGMLHFITR